jgi:GrpB-like predicted nucleotidyltransferase (UPF0157 family)
MALRFVPLDYVSDKCELVRRDLMGELEVLLPLADFQHVGSTAVPRGWTSGEVDVQVRVLASELAEAEQALAARFTRDEVLGKAAGFAGFIDENRGARVQLCELGGAGDLGGRRRQMLMENPLLRDRYDSIKRRHQGGDAKAYHAEKAAFWKGA